MSDLSDSRKALHGVAEWLLSGPEYAESGTIRLIVVPEGFRTMKAPEVLVTGTHVIGPGGEAAIDGSTISRLGAAIGVSPETPRAIYHDSSEVEVDDPLRVDAASAAVVLASFSVGAAALTQFAPDEQAVLWPEHFDVGISVAGANYGVSPGDHYIGEPYAYVGPWGRKQIPDPMFNQPFGASMSLAELGDVSGVVSFFERGRDIVAAHD